MKQATLFGDELPKEESEYTSKIKAPIYTPRGTKPHELALFDDTKTKRLINEIENSEISDDEKKFLIAAARRHTIFNYGKIADYYAHSSPAVQELMEKSALVIIDFEKAIQLGYVQLTEEIGKIYLEEHG